LNPPFAVIIDTNVLVSALITSDAASPVCKILDHMLAGGFIYLLSPDLLAEYRQVLLRPNIQRHHGMVEKDLDCLLEELVANAAWRDPETSDADTAPDLGDNHLWALLASQPDSVLITGDQLLLKKPPLTNLVMTPRDFIDSVFES